MGNIGVPELLIILVVALIVFGPKKLPELGKSLGKGISEFRKASSELQASWEEGVKDIEKEASQPNPSGNPSSEAIAKNANEGREKPS